MRPIHLFAKLLNSPCSGSGLINNGDVEYDWQKLPVPVYPAELYFDDPNLMESGMENQQNKGDTSQPQLSGNAQQPPRHETRSERLQRIRAEIDAGVYETNEKLEAAVDRMLGVFSDL